jgi:DNA-binding transcriptional MerR regulator
MPSSRSTGRAQESAPRGRAGFTSREAAQISGVPFFTVDYWDRSKFLKPSIARSTGRGKGHGRLYSYGDILRLRIARELREQHVSLQTLRYVVERLGEKAQGLSEARYVVVGKGVQLARDLDELVEILRTGRRTFGFVLDLIEIQSGVAARAEKLARRLRARSAASSNRA